jgi:hypothetical protein
MKPDKHNDWHYARPDLANKYLQLFEMGLTSARGLFARRRMGKTEFLKKDFIPAAQAKGYLVVYVNLWDLEIDPATALISEFYKAFENKGLKKFLTKFKPSINKVKASGNITGLGGSLEVDLTTQKKITGTMLMEAMTAFDKTKYQMILVIDEAQVLAYSENSHFAHALRAALDIRKDRIKVMFAGSSENTLRRMFGVASEPFYNWAPLESFELLGQEFVESMVERVNKISKYPLSLEDALAVFSELKNTPEFFRQYIEQYLLYPEAGSQEALDVTKKKVYSDQNFNQLWESLLATDRVLLSIIAAGKTDIYGQAVHTRLANQLGLAEGTRKTTIQNSLRRLANKHIITKLDYGIYQFEDEAFADWVKHKD